MNLIPIIIGIIASLILSVLVDWLLKLILPEHPKAKQVIVGMSAIIFLIIISIWASYVINDKTTEDQRTQQLLETLAAKENNTLILNQLATLQANGITNNSGSQTPSGVFFEPTGTALVEKLDELQLENEGYKQTVEAIQNDSPVLTSVPTQITSTMIRYKVLNHSGSNFTIRLQGETDTSILYNLTVPAGTTKVFEVMKGLYSQDTLSCEGNRSSSQIINAEDDLELPISSSYCMAILKISNTTNSDYYIKLIGIGGYDAHYYMTVPSNVVHEFKILVGKYRRETWKCGVQEVIKEWVIDDDIFELVSNCK